MNTVNQLQTTSAKFNELLQVVALYTAPCLSITIMWTSFYYITLHNCVQCQAYNNPGRPGSTNVNDDAKN